VRPAPLPSLPPSRITDVPGGGLEWIDGGQGVPAIVLVNGAGGPLAGWSRVFGPLCECSRVIAWNRPGIGRSDPPRSPQDGDAVIDALRDLLRAAGVPPPYVLVAHSLGGLFAILHARRHPDEVAGVVFLDAAHPADRQLQALQPRWLRGLNRVLGGRTRSGDPRETAHVDETIRRIAAAGPFPDVPLVTVAAGRTPPGWLMPERAVHARRANQEALAALSPRGRLVIARRSGHVPQLSEPDVVVEAVRSVVERARADGGASVG
jgi:pimeloyl-ACP methyl ester carboxylesterase